MKNQMHNYTMNMNVLFTQLSTSIPASLAPTYNNRDKSYGRTQLEVIKYNIFK